MVLPERAGRGRAADRAQDGHRGASREEDRGGGRAQVAPPRQRREGSSASIRSIAPLMSPAGPGAAADCCRMADTELAMADNWLKRPAQQKHPHADATYRIVPITDSAYGVEVAIPDSSPVMVTSFATEGVAQAWIAEHKRQVESGPILLK